MIFACDALDLNSMIGVTLLTCLLYLSVMCLQFHVHVPPQNSKAISIPFCTTVKCMVCLSQFTGVVFLRIIIIIIMSMPLKSLHNYAFILIIVEFQVVVVVLEEGAEEGVGLLVPVLQRQVPSRTTKETK